MERAPPRVRVWDKPPLFHTVKNMVYGRGTRTSGKGYAHLLEDRGVEGRLIAEADDVPHVIVEG